MDLWDSQKAKEKERRTHVSIFTLYTTPIKIRKKEERKKKYQRGESASVELWMKSVFVRKRNGRRVLADALHPSWSLVLLCDEWMVGVDRFQSSVSISSMPLWYVANIG